MITAGPPDGSAASAAAAGNVVPSAEVSSSLSAPAPPAIRGRRTRSAGRSGGGGSKAKHTATLLGWGGGGPGAHAPPAKGGVRGMPSDPTTAAPRQLRGQVGCPPMSILGNRVTRSEDPRFITGTATFGEDVDLPGAMHAPCVRSVLPQAQIRSIDTSGVSSIPGARAFTASGGPGAEAAGQGTTIDLPVMPHAMPGLNEKMTRPVIATDTVRYAGEIVAIVVPDDRLQGPDAAELVVVDYDELPPVPDPRAAANGETLLFPDAGTNVCAQFPAEEPDEHLFGDCEVVVTTTFDSQRLASCPMECRVATASWGDDGRLTHWASSQTPHATRDPLAAALDVDAARVRVIVPDVGGGFGPKGGAAVEDIIVAWLARELGRPVRWIETRGENMAALGRGRPQHQQLTLGGDRDGTLKAYGMEILQDSGASPDIGAILPM